jgi:hypothetical protein
LEACVNRTLQLVVPAAALAVACGLPQLRAAGPTPAEIASWIEQLGSPEFARREAASKSLLATGSPAVEPLAAAVRVGDLEVASRGIEILRDMLTDTPAAEAAEAALERCAESGSSAAARLAAAALAFHQLDRAAAARTRLEELGAIFHDEPIVELAGLNVELGRGWKGADDDLRELTRLPRLEAVSIHGVPLDARAAAVIGRLHGLRRLELFGTGLDEAAVAVLSAKLPGTEIDVRRGGKLGVGGLPFGGGCEIQTVQPGSAADQAGIRPGDTVLTLDGQPIISFDDLTARLAGRGPGDVIRIAVGRQGRAADGDADRLEFNVRLDAW